MSGVSSVKRKSDDEEKVISKRNRYTNDTSAAAQLEGTVGCLVAKKLDFPTRALFASVSKATSRVIHLKESWPKSLELPCVITQEQFAAGCAKWGLVTDLDLSCCYGISDFGPLAALSRLQSLNLSNHTFDKAPDLSHIKSLVHVKFNSCEELKDISSLSQSKNLTGLDLSKCRQLQSIRTVLRQLPALKTLKLRNAQVVQLDEIPSLEYLDISYYGGIALSLGRLPKLKTLNISHAQHLRALPNLSGLTELSVLDLSVCHELMNISELVSVPQLSRLEMQETPLLVDMSALANLNNLLYLDLSSRPHLLVHEKLDLELLTGMKQLQTLSLAFLKAVDDVTPLVNLQQLTTLNLSYCSLKDISSLSNLSLLVSLNLVGCNYLRNIQPLKKLHRLQYLFLPEGRNVFDAIER